MAQALAEKFEITGPAKKERVVSVPQREQLASTPEPPLPRGEGTEPSSRVQDHEGGETQGGEPHLGEKERGSVREYEEERVDSTVKKADSKEEREDMQEEPS